jgi:hypothetical protein
VLLWMPVKSQIALRPNPVGEPWRASRMRKTLEITPTGAARAADSMNRVVEDLAIATLPPDLEDLFTAFPARNSVSIGKTLACRARKSERIVSSFGTSFTDMKFLVDNI